MKISTLFLTLFTLSIASIGRANEWSHRTITLPEAKIRVSFTKQYVPATYGFSGGMAAGELYVDVHAHVPIHVESGSFNQIAQLQFVETNPTHAYAKKAKEQHGGQYLWIGQPYILQLTINGRTHQLRLTL